MNTRAVQVGIAALGTAAFAVGAMSDTTMAPDPANPDPGPLTKQMKLASLALTVGGGTALVALTSAASVTSTNAHWLQPAAMGFVGVASGLIFGAMTGAMLRTPASD